jgi:hypothetical protein
LGVVRQGSRVGRKKLFGLPTPAHCAHFPTPTASAHCAVPRNSMDPAVAVATAAAADELTADTKPKPTSDADADAAAAAAIAPLVATKPAKCDICEDTSGVMLQLGACFHEMCDSCLSKLPMVNSVKLCPFCRTAIFWAMKPVRGLPGATEFVAEVVPRSAFGTLFAQLVLPKVAAHPQVRMCAPISALDRMRFVMTKQEAAKVLEAFLAVFDPVYVLDETYLVFLLKVFKEAVDRQNFDALDAIWTPIMFKLKALLVHYMHSAEVVFAVIRMFASFWRMEFDRDQTAYAGMSNTVLVQALQTHSDNFCVVETALKITTWRMKTEMLSVQNMKAVLVQLEVTQAPSCCWGRAADVLVGILFERPDLTAFVEFKDLVFRVAKRSVLDTSLEDENFLTGLKILFVVAQISGDNRAVWEFLAQNEALILRTAFNSQRRYWWCKVIRKLVQSATVSAAEAVTRTVPLLVGIMHRNCVRKPFEFQPIKCVIALVGYVGNSLEFLDLSSVDAMALVVDIATRVFPVVLPILPKISEEGVFVKADLLRMLLQVARFSQENRPACVALVQGFFPWLGSIVGNICTNSLTKVKTLVQGSVPRLCMELLAELTVLDPPVFDTHHQLILDLVLSWEDTVLADWVPATVKLIRGIATGPARYLGLVGETVVKKCWKVITRARTQFSGLPAPIETACMQDFVHILEFMILNTSKDLPTLDMSASGLPVVHSPSPSTSTSNAGAGAGAGAGDVSKSMDIVPTVPAYLLEIAKDLHVMSVLKMPAGFGSKPITAFNPEDSATAQTLARVMFACLVGGAPRFIVLWGTLDRCAWWLGAHEADPKNPYIMWVAGVLLAYAHTLLSERVLSDRDVAARTAVQSRVLSLLASGSITAFVEAALATPLSKPRHVCVASIALGMVAAMGCLVGSCMLVRERTAVMALLRTEVRDVNVLEMCFSCFPSHPSVLTGLAKVPVVDPAIAFGRKPEDVVVLLSALQLLTTEDRKEGYSRRRQAYVCMNLLTWCGKHGGFEMCSRDVLMSVVLGAMEKFDSDIVVKQGVELLRVMETRKQAQEVHEVHDDDDDDTRTSKRVRTE